MKNSFAYSLVILLLFTYGCSEKKLRKAYGMKPHYHLTGEEIKARGTVWNIDPIMSIDTSILSYLNTFGPEYTFYKENHIHPLQAIFYNKDGRPVSFITGTFADAGIRNLKWNQNKSFDNFPPRTLAPLDDIFTFNKHLSFIRTLDGNSIDSSRYTGVDYNVVVMYSEFTGRQTKRFLKEIAENREMGKRFKMNYIFVNTDNLYPEDQH